MGMTVAEQKPMTLMNIRTYFLGGFLATAVATAAPGASADTGASTETDRDELWSGLAQTIFGGRELEDGAGMIALDMPDRAEDAAIVPVTIRSLLAADDPRNLEAVTLVIDENPAPVAARFELGPRSGVTTIATRVRVNTYTRVHAVAELSDGKLYVAETFVKASGGCSAPALKNPDDARKTAGQMRFRQFSKPDDARREAQIMVRHPNNTGLQMNQLTRLYIPAYFIDDLTIHQGDELVLSMEGGISISENPNIRFDYKPNGAATFRAEATDTDGRRYTGEWEAAGISKDRNT